MNVCEKHLPQAKVEHEGEECPLCRAISHWQDIARASFETGLAFVQASLGCPLGITAPQAEPYRTIGETLAHKIGAIREELIKKLQGDRRIVTPLRSV